MIGSFAFRLTIWLLLTANFSWSNVIIGLMITLLLPRGSTSSERLEDLLKGIGKIIVAIPQAYLEAIYMILRPHTQETVYMERVSLGRSPGLIFLDIFRIAFTPKTIVLKFHESNWYEIHKVQQRKQS
ncbi:MAG: cation:proton antiporter [Synechococcales cyanobacterium RU_4_20]|nr:cation:proton antiporter [Synechococcales cyanobacterium RU_4_20]NJR70138.1 cation:proton antiporter [Synechococcales cyanobacterium CRU_2_2]